MIEAATAAASIPADEADRVGVYVLAFLVGLIVTGLIACARHLRNDIAPRD